MIPGGGFRLGEEGWVGSREGFFLPVRVLSRLFRGKFLAHLQQAWVQEELGFHGNLQELTHPNAWQGWLEPLRTKEWVVYSKPPFGGPSRVLKYLARYTHRVAISNQRLVSIDDVQVSFRFKD